MTRSALLSLPLALAFGGLACVVVDDEGLDAREANFGSCFGNDTIQGFDCTFGLAAAKPTNAEFTVCYVDLPIPTEFGWAVHWHARNNSSKCRCEFAAKG